MLQRHMFDDVLDAVAPSAVPAGWPAITLRENDNAFVLEAEVPGLKGEEISIVVEKGTLVLSGARKTDAPAGYRVLVRERVPARFSRTLALPARVDAENVAAKLANGVLTITLPKVAEARPRQIAVKVG
jgi:HSP20 family protein